MTPIERSATRADVTVVDPDRFWVQCNACGERWSPNFQSGGTVPRGWRACPRGCNREKLGN